MTLLDFKGFGESKEPDFAYGVPEYTADILNMMDSLKIKSATLVAHSFGGRVAVEIASNQKCRVDRLVLIDSAGLKPRRGIKYHFLIYLNKIAKKLGYSGLKGSNDYRVLSPRMKQTFVKVVSYNQDDKLRKISCPTAIFWGKSDKTTPKFMAKKFKAGIKDSEIFWLNGGHFAYIEDFDKFMLVLNAFLCSDNSEPSCIDNINKNTGMCEVAGGNVCSLDKAIDVDDSTCIENTIDIVDLNNGSSTDKAYDTSFADEKNTMKGGKIAT